MLKHSYANIDGTRIKYVTAGKRGKTIILVHGLGSSSKYFAPLMEVLAKKYIVIAPDQPSFGGSENRKEKLDVSKLADFYLKFIKQLGIKEHALLANSLGTQISVEIVTRHTTNTKALILISPTVNRHERNAFMQITRFMQSSFHEPVKEIKIQLLDFKHAGIIRLIRTLRHALKDKIEAKLPLVKQSSLIIRGEMDTVCPEYWAEEVTALIPDANLRMIKNASHAPHYSNPKQIADMVDKFLSKH